MKKKHSLYKGLKTVSRKGETNKYIICFLELQLLEYRAFKLVIGEKIIINK